MNTENKGIQVTVIDIIPYHDFKKILDAIQKQGYKITIVGNGNAVCEKRTTGD